jgi:hypothetical protein
MYIISNLLLAVNPHRRGNDIYYADVNTVLCDYMLAVNPHKRGNDIYYAVVYTA